MPFHLSLAMDREHRIRYWYRDARVGAGWLVTSLSTNPIAVALVQVAGAMPMFFLASRA